MRSDGFCDPDVGTDGIISPDLGVFAHSCYDSHDLSCEFTGGGDAKRLSEDYQDAPWETAVERELTWGLSIV